MTYLARPKIELPGQKTNAIGLTLRDYEGALSTLCAGCGHDSVTAAIIQAVFELDIEPHMLAHVLSRRLDSARQHRRPVPAETPY